MTIRSLIIRADNFGLSHAANMAIEEAFETGVLTSAALAIVGPWSAEAALLMRAHPQWEVGLQLVLQSPAFGCRWGPVAGARAAPSLVQPTGEFFVAVPDAADPIEIERELDAQLLRFRAWGIEPAFVVYPGLPPPNIVTALRQLAAKHNLPSVCDAPKEALFLPANDPHPGVDVIRNRLVDLGPGTYLWIVHPAAETPETWALWGDDGIAAAHGAEAQLLYDPLLRELFIHEQIDLVGMRQDPR